MIAHPLVGPRVLSERSDRLDRLRAARAIEQAADQRLQLAETIRNDLVWSLSHELRTPIASIIGYTELLRDEESGPLNSEQDLMLSRVAGNAARLLNLVEELLRGSRIESGDLVLTPVEVDVCRLVDDAVAHAGSTLCAKHLDIAVDLNPAPVLVWGDARDLLVLVNSLLSNAMKFTPDGGHLSVTVRVVDGECLLLVADSGCGIPAEEQALVFNRFYRSTVATLKAIPGIGLGLSTARAIATMHGGRIEVESQVGTGSSFAVHLPLAGPPTPASLTG